MRSGVIDTAKGLGIVLVVIGHEPGISGGDNELFNILFSFHLPFFFFVSGVLLGWRQPFVDILKRRADALLKPYVVVALTAATVGVLAGWVALSPGQLFKLAWGSGGFIVSATGQAAWAPLWFLPHLFLVSLLAVPLLRASLPRPPLLQAVLVLTLLLAGGGLLQGWGRYLNWEEFEMAGRRLALAGLPFSADLVPISLAFMMAGGCLSAAARRFVWQPVRALLVLAAFALLHVFSNATLDLNERRYDDLLITSLQAGLGIYLMFALAALAERLPALTRAASALGAASLFILMLHWPVQAVLHALLATISLPAPLQMLAVNLAAILLPLLFFRLAQRQVWLARLLLPAR